MGWRGEVMNPRIFIRSVSKKKNALGKLWKEQSSEGKFRP
jgi:hypothetical protein